MANTSESAIVAGVANMDLKCERTNRTPAGAEEASQRKWTPNNLERALTSEEEALDREDSTWKVNSTSKPDWVGTIDKDLPEVDQVLKYRNLAHSLQSERLSGALHPELGEIRDKCLHNLDKGLLELLQDTANTVESLRGHYRDEKASLHRKLRALEAIPDLTRREAAKQLLKQQYRTTSLLKREYSQIMVDSVLARHDSQVQPATLLDHRRLNENSPGGLSKEKFGEEEELSGGLTHHRV